MNDPDDIDQLTGGQHHDSGKAQGLLARRIVLTAFVLFTVGAGAFIGAASPPGDWYAGLQKPFFNPPDWIFGPVWTLLYTLVAIAGWRTWQHGFKSLAMQLWFAQLGFNLLWSPAFFGMQRPGLALGVLAIMIVLTALFIVQVRRHDAVTGLLMWPYMAWICFAGMLNLAIFWMN